MDYFPDYMAVALLGVLVGVGELISRYRDEPTRALFARPGSFELRRHGRAGVGCEGARRQNYESATCGHHASNTLNG